LEYIDGIKISEFDKLEEAGLNKKIIASNGGHSILKQIFDHGFFHADPHPGNIFVLPGNVIAPLDFGMMGSLDNDLRDALGDMLTAVVEKDVNRIIRVFNEIGITDNLSDERGLKIDVTDFLERYYQLSLYQLDIEKVITEFTDIIRRHGIKLPADFALIGKALVTEEGVGRALDPDFDLITMVKPYVQELMARRLDPRRQMQEFAYTLDDFSRLLKIFPSDFRSIVTKIKKGDLRVGFEHYGLEHFISELDKSSNRLAFSLIIAAFVIGSSIIIQLDRGPMIFGFPVLGILGYSIAAILGLWLAIAIIRSGKL
jgi:ubiquinone biosynthesis protein